MIPPLIPPSGHPLTHIRERFELHSSSHFPEALVGECPTAHPETGQFLAEVGADSLWHLSACDFGCSPEVIWESSGVDRQEPGAKDDEALPAPPQPRQSIFRTGYRQLTSTELLADPPPLEFILSPYIPRGCVSVLSGPGGSNKTTLLIYAAVCRALGRQMWRGCVPEEGETVILTTEDRIDDYHRKIAALRVHLGADFDAGLVASRLHFIDLAGTPVRFVASERGEMFIPTDHVDILAEVLRELAPRADWITLETVSRLTGGIENNSSLSILVEATQRLCKLTGPRVAATLVAHVSQDAARNGTADAYSSRGGSALGDNGRSSMVLTGLNENNVEKFAPGIEIDPEQMKRLIVFAHPKGNGTPPTEPVILQRHSTPYGPVLELADLERPFSTQGIKPKGKGGRPQTMALDQLQKAIVEAIIIASNVITANGVFEVVGGSRNRCMATIKDMVLAGNLSDAGLGLEVVLNPFSTNLIPVEYQSGSTGSGTGTRKPPYKNKGGFSGTRYHPTGTEVMEFSTTTADQTNSQPEDQPLTKQGDD